MKQPWHHWCAYLCHRIFFSVQVKEDTAEKVEKKEEKKVEVAEAKQKSAKNEDEKVLYKS